MELKKTLDALATFENKADLLTFLDMFGKEGYKRWEQYKGRCNYSPLRLYKDLQREGKEDILIKRIGYWL